MRQQFRVRISGLIRNRLKASRKRGASWIKILDLIRLLPSAEGRGRLWTLFLHRRDVHQTSPLTAEERYPDLFDLAERRLPAAARILSFGCSTGEELSSLRKRFPDAMIIGAEINGRSRRIAAEKLIHDKGIALVPPSAIDGDFDAIFALAVFQREPHKIAEMDVENLSDFYPFERFDRTLSELVGHLRPGGILCVANAHYRVEDSSVAGLLRTVEGVPESLGLLFDAGGKRLIGKRAKLLFIKS